MFGNRNSLWLDVLSADPERGLVLEEPAYDNLILSAGLAGGFTNKAKHPTNRLIAPSAAETVATPAVPASGQEVANRNLGPVQVQILTSGKVLEWAQTDSKGQSCTLRSGLTPGQTSILNPGDKVRFTHQEAPSWSWKGFRARIETPVFFYLFSIDKKDKSLDNGVQSGDGCGISRPSAGALL